MISGSLLELDSWFSHWESFGQRGQEEYQQTYK